MSVCLGARVRGCTTQEMEERPTSKTQTHHQINMSVLTEESQCKEIQLRKNKCTGIVNHVEIDLNSTKLTYKTNIRLNHLTQIKKLKCTENMG